jgi:protein arginine kinase
MKRETTSAPKIYELKNPWLESSHPIWIASRISLVRNLKPYKFPHKEERGRSEHILELLTTAFKESSVLDHPEVIRAEDLDFSAKEFLLEHFLAPEDFYKIHENEAFVFDNGGRFFSTINFKNHLNLSYLETRQELEDGWSYLLKVEEELGKKLEFAFNPRFGYITSDPKECGTALHTTLFLHIPAIAQMGELPELLEHSTEEEIHVSTLQGNMNEVIGDLLLVRNQCSIGLSEESIITSMRLWATKAMVSEMNWRKKIIDTQDKTIKTKISRALGLISHSYQLELVEALNALSLIKLGVEIGWVEAPSEINLNSLLFSCRRAHMMHLMGEKFDAEQLSKKRAEYLKQVSLKFKMTVK